MQTGTKCISKLKGIIFASLNIRRLISKTDDLSVLLTRSNLDFLQKTVLDGNIRDVCLELEGYDMHRLDKNPTVCKASGGGLAIYSNCKYEFEPLNHASVMNRDLEVMWTVLRLKETRPTYLANVYRPPDGDLNSALQTLDEQIT